MTLTYSRFLLLIVLISIPGEVFSQQSVARLQTDFLENRISLHDYLVNRGYAVFAPERLAPQYRFPGDLPDKCATEIVSLLKSEYNILTPQEQAFFQKFLFRPTLPESYVSPDGFFKIHYATSGVDQVPPDDNNTNGVPDFVEEAGIAYDRAYHLYEDLGYRIPPVDNVDGDEYDVYMVHVGEATYGFTTAETDQQGTPWYDPTSYITTSNDFQGSQLFTQDLDALRVTAAHEYHHSVQFAYIFRNSDIFYYEMTSTWFEDILYDEVDDYLQYLPTLFGDDSNPSDPKVNSFSRPITVNDGLHKYGMAIWIHFLAKRFGYDIIRSTWEQMHLQSAISTLEKVINEEASTTFEDELHAFNLWNYFTGSRADTLNYYPEGNLYPELVFNETIDDANDTSFVIKNRQLSTQYIAINKQRAATFEIALEALSGSEDNWRASAVLSDDFSLPTTQPIPFLDGISGRASLFSFGSNPELVLIMTMTSKTAQSGRFSLSIDLTLTGPPAFNANKLLPTIPSPANFSEISKVLIPFVMAEPDEIELKIYSISGALIKSFPKQSFFPGLYEASTPFIWYGTDDNNEQVPSGIYIYIMKGEKFLSREKMAIIR